MSSTYAMTAYMLPFMVLLMVSGYYIFVPQEFKKKQDRAGRHRFLLGTVPYILTAILLYTGIHLREYIPDILGIDRGINYATYIIMVEGDAVARLQDFAGPVLTYASGAVYLLGFSFLLLFTFFVLIYTRNLRALQEFSIAYTTIYILSSPIHTFIPVKVTGHTLANVQTLLYDLSPVIEQGVRYGDFALDNCFPSLHAALSVMTMIVILTRTDLKRYKIFTVIMAIAIQFTILYLGIHWISDMVAGIILAFIGFFIATQYREIILKVPQRVLVGIERRAGIHDTIACIKCSQDIQVVPHLPHAHCPHCGTAQNFHPLTYNF